MKQLRDAVLTDEERNLPARRVGRRKSLDVLVVDGRVVGHVPQCDGDARHVLEGETLLAQSVCKESASQETGQ